MLNIRWHSDHMQWLLHLQKQTRLGILPICGLFVCLFVCLNDLPIKGIRQTPTKGLNTKLATVNFSHTNIGLTSMIINHTNQEIVIQ